MVARDGGEATAGGFPLGWWLPSRRRRPHLVDADLQPRAERGEMLVAHPLADGVIVVLGLILLVRERIGPDRVDPGRTATTTVPLPLPSESRFRLTCGRALMCAIFAAFGIEYTVTSLASKKNRHEPG